MTTRKKHLSLAVLAALGSMTTAASSTAQDGRGQPVALEEVIVTASRREQSLRDVAASVVAVDPADFALKGLQSVEDVVRYTPGVQFESRGQPGLGTLTARGIPQLASTPVFAIYADETPVTSSTAYANGDSIFLDGMLLDVERVEIIKGPQGTLWGASAVGGALRYITSKPNLQAFEGSLGLDVNSVSSGDTGNTVSGRVSIPLIEDKLGLTIAGFTRDVAGYVDRVQGPMGIDPGKTLDRDVDGGDVEGYSFDLLYQATDDLGLRLNYLKQESSSDALSEVTLAGPGSTDGLLGDYSSVEDGTRKEVEFEVVSGTITYDMAFATLISSTSYAENSLLTAQDVTRSFGPLIDLLLQRPVGTSSLTFDAESRSEKFVQEIRLASRADGDLEWQAGLYYTDEDTSNVQGGRIEPDTPVVFSDASFPSNYTEAAVFGSVTYYFSDNFDVQLGARYSDNEIELDFTAEGLLVTGGPRVQSRQVIDDTVDTYLLSARYRPGENVSLYTTIASGYRPATPNLPVVNLATGDLATTEFVESDTSWSYEAGAKGWALDGLISYDLALWYATYDNFQAPLLVNGLNTITNADSGLSAYGFESVTALNLTDDFEITLNMGYTHSTLDDDEPGFGGEKDQDIPGVPSWKASLQWSYAFELAAGWNASFGGGVRYIDDFVTNFPLAGALAGEVDSRVITDVNLGVERGPYRLSLYATNLFDERDLTARTDTEVAPGFVNSAGIFERPRTLGVNLRYDF
ncbi:TonB-dependent receptor [Parahaliea mediterranea]|uniref:TonB-dependent receptor n=1 Tax=Parahaliea mediterranea TaxID=651086 RepID=A0A939IMZ6_9GAMM|nr:TonB-dependent receptor [Parahaliea mediterranea]MBN7797522.1 TonB-dependent receptor [Parahaliea mediterranea]